MNVCIHLFCSRVEVHFDRGKPDLVAYGNRLAKCGYFQLIKAVNVK